MTLSDIGSWASIIGFILSFISGLAICRFTKENKQVNKFFSIFTIGNTNQSNHSSQ